MESLVRSLFDATCAPSARLRIAAVPIMPPSKLRRVQSICCLPINRLYNRLRDHGYLPKSLYESFGKSSAPVQRLVAADRFAVINLVALRLEHVAQAPV